MNFLLRIDNNYFRYTSRFSNPIPARLAYSAELIILINDDGSGNVIKSRHSDYILTKAMITARRRHCEKYNYISIEEMVALLLKAENIT